MSDGEDSEGCHCADCGLCPPDGASEYTLIGDGWRLIKITSPQGQPGLEWRCPSCFAKRRSQAAAPPGQQENA